MTRPELIEILKAAEAGKVIEYSEHPAIKWRTALGDGPRTAGAECRKLCELVANRFHLRIKPEPREWWIVDGRSYYPCAFVRHSDAKKDADANGLGRVIRVREVIE